MIGYLKEEAPKDEQSFPMVMEMLNYAEGAKEDGDKDVIDILMEETAARTHLREEYFSDYRRYQLMQVDKTRVLLACRVIINDLLGSCTAMITTSAMTAFWTMATAFPEN